MMTRKQRIEALQQEGGAAGDDATVTLCDLALEGDVAALAECERIIAMAQLENQCKEHGCARWQCDADHEVPPCAD